MRLRNSSPLPERKSSILSGPQFAMGNRSTPNLLATAPDETASTPVMESLQLTASAISRNSRSGRNDIDAQADDSDGEVLAEDLQNYNDADNQRPWQSDARPQAGNKETNNHDEEFETVNIDDPSTKSEFRNSAIVPTTLRTADSHHNLSNSAHSSGLSLEDIRRMRSVSISSTRSTPYSPADDALAALSLKSFWRWILCFCVVNFDLELGQGSRVCQASAH